MGIYYVVRGSNSIRMFRWNDDFMVIYIYIYKYIYPKLKIIHIHFRFWTKEQNKAALLMHVKKRQGEAVRRAKESTKQHLSLCSFLPLQLKK